MTDEYLDRKTKLPETVITSKDATRHKTQLLIRGSMVIELAQQLSAITGIPAALHIRHARRMATEMNR